MIGFSEKNLCSGPSHDLVGESIVAVFGHGVGDDLSELLLGFFHELFLERHIYFEPERCRLLWEGPRSDDFHGSSRETRMMGSPSQRSQ